MEQEAAQQFLTGEQHNFAPVSIAVVLVAEFNGLAIKAE